MHGLSLFAWADSPVCSDLACEEEAKLAWIPLFCCSDGDGESTPTVDAVCEFRLSDVDERLRLCSELTSVALDGFDDAWLVTVNIEAESGRSMPGAAPKTLSDTGF